MPFCFLNAFEKYISEFNIKEELDIIIEGYKFIYPKNINIEMNIETNKSYYNCCKKLFFADII